MDSDFSGIGGGIVACTPLGKKTEFGDLESRVSLYVI